MFEHSLKENFWKTLKWQTEHRSPAPGPTAAISTHPISRHSARASARPRPGAAAGWNGDYGFGIIDPLAVATANDV
jgi:hypothetical protein